ncbi:MAG: Iron-regulated protein precursor [bacterium]|nr:Iron-regulated protein precursor [bacterium]
MAPLRRLLVVVATVAAGCGAPDPTAAVVKQYALMMRANALDAAAKVQSLQSAVDAFVAAPSAGGFADAQSAWLDTRTIYGELEVSRFYGGPIDTVQGRVNEWPIDETFVDYTAGNPTGGIINDPQHFPQLTPAVLASSDERGGIENLSTGFHAIEFLLWGQRLDPTEGPGQRPYTDYVDGGTATNQARRRTYLAAATQLLLSDLTSVAAQWDLADPSSYASTMAASPPHDALQLILRGYSNMAVSELYYERMTNPFLTQNRKDEESCFSESTAIDLSANALGVENVWLGRYGALAGPSLAELVKAKNASLAATMTSQLAAARAAVDAIPPPFDHAVLAPAGSDAHDKVQAALTALAPLADTIRSIAMLLGVTVNI